MDISVFLAVIFAAFLHALWNSMVKSHADKHVAVAAIVLGHVPASIIIIFLVPMPAIESLPYIIASAIIHQGYQWFLLTAYKVWRLYKSLSYCAWNGARGCHNCFIIVLWSETKHL